MVESLTPLSALGARRILMTGGTGFVGAHFCPLLARAAPEAERLLVRMPGDGGAREGWRSVDAAITDRARLAALVRDFKPDLVLHFAAQASGAASWTAGEQTWRVNFDGALELASATAAHAPGATFFFVSSSETYGRSFMEGPADETTPLLPMNAYARSKAAAETMLPDVLGPDQKLIVVRPFNHTGAGQDTRFVAPAFAAQIAAIEAGAEPVVRVGDLSARREFLDVRDVCAAYLALLGADLGANLGARETFNVCTGRAYAIADLLAGLRARARRPFEVVQDPARMRPSDIAHASGAPDRLYAATGWRPAFALDDTLDALMADWRARQP